MAGHLFPSSSIAHALEGLGHEVAWVVQARAAWGILPASAKLFTLDDAAVDGCFAMLAKREQETGVAADNESYWEHFFLPLARVMVPAIEAAVAAFAPDVLLVDQQTLGGAVVARRHGLRWATLVTTPQELLRASMNMPESDETRSGYFALLEREMGLPHTTDLDVSPHLCIVLSTRELARQWFAPQMRLVGPAIAARVESTPFPFEALREGPRVFISLGTMNGDVSGPFHDLVLEAFAGDEIQVVLAGAERPASQVPPNVIVRPFVPQLGVLARMDAAVCHAGHNTVCESLWFGLPLVVVPVKADQPFIAQQVVDAGVGVRLDFLRLKAGELREAVHRVLAEPSYRAAAARVQRSFQEAGGSQHAAEHLAELAQAGG
ncbi:glycosyltransferase [Chondromyces apiculatus]|nr:glycosyltransferase [Chondromyces apiculatus]